MSNTSKILEGAVSSNPFIRRRAEKLLRSKGVATPTESVSATDLAVRRRLSERVEDTVEGLIGFVLRYLRTSAFVAVQPWRVSASLATGNDEHDSRFVLPLTFLAIAFFLFGVVVEASGGNIVNVIWLANDAGQDLVKKLQEGPSLTGITAAALPGILSVVVAMWVLRGIVCANRVRLRGWIDLGCYVFGYQALAIFGIALVLLVAEAPESRYEIGIQLLQHSSVIQNFLLAIYALLLLSVLVCPAVALTTAVIRDSSARRPLRVLLAIAVAPAATVIVPAAYTFAGTLVPSLVDGLFPKSSSFVKSDDRKMSLDLSQIGIAEITTKVGWLIVNHTDTPISINTESLLFTIRQQQTGNTRDDANVVAFGLVTLRTEDRQVELPATIVVDAHSERWFQAEFHVVSTWMRSYWPIDGEVCGFLRVETIDNERLSEDCTHRVEVKSWPKTVPRS